MLKLFSEMHKQNSANQIQQKLKQQKKHKATIYLNVLQLAKTKPL